VISGVEGRVPPFFKSAAEFVLGKSPLGKMFSFFEDVRGARKGGKRS
jgi:hypothetical protein